MRRIAKHQPNGRLSPEEIRELQEKVRRRDRERCVICLGRRGVAVHELIPRSGGQTRSPEIFNEQNMVCLCLSCHTHWHTSPELSNFRLQVVRRIGRHMRQFYPSWEEPVRLTIKRAEEENNDLG